jgi:hypothetical protein
MTRRIIIKFEPHVGRLPQTDICADVVNYTSDHAHESTRLSGGGGSFGLVLPPLDREGGFRAAAHDFFNGLNVFCDSKKQPMHSVLLLASFGIECALKSFLSGRGIDEVTLAKKYSHNLELLWTQAVKEGLDMPPQVPDWLMQVHLQNQPSKYHIRYVRMRTTDSPGTRVLRDGLKKLLEAVDRPPAFSSASSE